MLISIFGKLNLFLLLLMFSVFFDRLSVKISKQIKCSNLRRAFGKAKRENKHCLCFDFSSCLSAVVLSVFSLAKRLYNMYLFTSYMSMFYTYRFKRNLNLPVKVQIQIHPASQMY